MKHNNYIVTRNKLSYPALLKVRYLSLCLIATHSKFILRLYDLCQITQNSFQGGVNVVSVLILETITKKFH